MDRDCICILKEHAHFINFDPAANIAHTLTYTYSTNTPKSLSAVPEVTTEYIEKGQRTLHENQPLFIVSANNLASAQIKYLINKRGTIITPCKGPESNPTRASGNESENSGLNSLFEHVCWCVLLLSAVAHVADKCLIDC